MRDLTRPSWIFAKGILLLVLGLLSASVLLLDHPEWRTFLLLTVTVWAFARFYYFLFYVIERYIDSSYQFRGVLAAIPYFIRRPAFLGKTRNGGSIE